jgi:hypothetical protein
MDGKSRAECLLPREPLINLEALTAESRFLKGGISCFARFITARLLIDGSGKRERPQRNNLFQPSDVLST